MMTNSPPEVYILERVYAKVLSESQWHINASQLHIQTVQDGGSQLFVPLSHADLITELEPDAWYRFDNILDVSNLSTSTLSPSCPHCGATLKLQSERANTALTLLNGEQTADTRYVALTDLNTTQISNTAIPTQHEFRKDVTWCCPQCYSPCPYDQEECAIAISDNQSLYERVSDVIESVQQTSQTHSTDSMQQCQQTLRAALSLDVSAVTGEEMANTSLRSADERVPVAVEKIQ